MFLFFDLDNISTNISIQRRHKLKRPIFTWVLFDWKRSSFFYARHTRKKANSFVWILKYFRNTKFLSYFKVTLFIYSHHINISGSFIHEVGKIHHFVDGLYIFFLWIWKCIANSIIDRFVNEQVLLFLWREGYEECQFINRNPYRKLHCGQMQATREISVFVKVLIVLHASAYHDQSKAHENYTQRY